MIMWENFIHIPSNFFILLLLVVIFALRADLKIYGNQKLVYQSLKNPEALV